jgi:hypothetical protein
MGITYRIGREERLSIAEMDNNFHYIEEQLAGLTSSNPDRLISTNDLEVVLDTKGTLNTPLLLPTEIWTATCDTNHMIGTYDLDNTLAWEFHFKFEVSQDGIVSTMVDNPFPILTNPGYLSGDSFRFTEADHGIPDFIFDIVLNDVDYPGDAGWTANLAVTEAPEYPSTIKSLGAVKITANDKNLILGTDGSLTFPNNSVQTTAYKPARVYTAILTQTGTNAPTAEIVFENTLDLYIAFFRDNVGEYRIVTNALLGLYSRTCVFITDRKISSPELYNKVYYSFAPGLNTIHLYNISNGGSGTKTDNLSCSIEIRVYTVVPEK